MPFIIPEDIKFINIDLDSVNRNLNYITEAFKNDFSLKLIK